MSDLRRTRAGNVAVDNMLGCERQKREIRAWVLDQVQPARVFDMFAGEGTLYRKIWHRAADYLGCDERWFADPPGRRMLGDSYEILRSVDLAPWNVFDIDCYGEPWRALLILAERKRWAPGERGAIVCTNSTLRQKFGFASHAAVAAVGLVDRVLKHSTVEERDAMRDLAIARWARASGVVLDQMRMARFTARSGMEYLAWTFTRPAASPTAARADAAEPPTDRRASPARRASASRPTRARR